MAGFTEAVLVKKLTDLNASQPSIQTLSLWLIHHRKRSKEVVSIWAKELKKLKVAKKLLCFMYLANDVIQNSKRKGADYANDFSTVLEKALGHVARHVDSKTLLSIKRIIEVWRDRGVYSKSTIDKYFYAITSNLTNKQLAEFGGTSLGEANRSKAGSSNNNRTNSASEADDVASPQNMPEDSDVLVSTTPPPNTTKMKTRTSELAPNEKPPETEELISSIKQLDNAASLDAQVRNEISKLPQEVADLKRLDLLTNKEQAEQLLEVVVSADSMLSSYNSRLAMELEQRKTMLKKLKAYLTYQRMKAEEDDKVLNQWKEKLAKLGRQRQELRSHIESLPDLSKLPVTQSLPPLPSSVDLL